MNKDESSGKRSVASRMRQLISSPSSLLTILLLCSLALNFQLTRKVASLKESLAARPGDGKLAAGTLVPPIEAKDLDQRPEVISYSGGEQPTVLYVFTPQCGWCTRNLQNMKALAESARGRYRFVMLSLSKDSLREYVAQNGLGGIPVYGDVSEDARESYKITGTPRTIVVSNEGRILKVWAGAYAGDTQKEVEEYFNIKLPGLTEIKTGQAGGS